MITLPHAIARLSASGEAIIDLVRSVNPEQATWKPTPEMWSVLEVLCHLYDEEREDFRQRVDFTLHKPTEDWPRIDPQGWVTQRAYNQRDFAECVQAFQRERQQSLQWLSNLQDANWDSAKDHPNPAIGKVTARDMLTAWVAHDHLHLRQLNELQWHYLATQAPAFPLEYAGGW